MVGPRVRPWEALRFPGKERAAGGNEELSTRSLGKANTERPEFPLEQRRQQHPAQGRTVFTQMSERPVSTPGYRPALGLCRQQKWIRARRADEELPLRSCVRAAGPGTVSSEGGAITPNSVLSDTRLAV